MKAEDLEEYVGKTVDEVQYGDGDRVAYLVFKDGAGLQIPVTPTFKEEDE